MSLQHLFRWSACLLVVLISVFTLSPIEARPVTGYSANLERFVAFALLGGAFGLAYPRHRLPILCLVVGLAGGLEFAQNFVPGRHGRVPDGAVKAAAAVIGVAAATVINRRT